MDRNCAAGYARNREAMRLIFTSGPREGEAFDLDGGRMMIGRVEDNDLRLVGEKISRHHAVIELDPDGRAVLSDLGSRNGTYVDGVRLAEPRVLEGGERLRFGDEHVMVESAPGPTRRVKWRLGRRATIAAAAAVILLVGLVVAQLVLPGVAENSLRSQLERYGPVRRVNVEAFPAVQLLWHHADEVDVSMDSYRSEPGGHTSLADFLSDTGSTGKLDARVGILMAQLVTLHNVRLKKDGNDVVGQGELTQHDLSAALPSFVGLRPVSASRNGIVVSASGSAFGKTARVPIRVLADGGKVVVQPDVPFGSFASIKVFSDARVYVQSLGAELHGNRYLLTARARLR